MLHHQEMQNTHLRNLFQTDAKRFTKFSLTAANIFLDYSKNRITEKTITLLATLAEQAQIKKHATDMFSGKIINTTEKRAVLHTALRDLKTTAIKVNNINIVPEIRAVLKQMGQCVEKIRERKWLGFSGKPIVNIVNIGIGGSHLGPMMVTKALTPYADNNLTYHFVSNIDGTSIAEALKHLNPEETIFIVASKTFTTQETLANATSAKNWLLKHAPKAKDAIKHHFLAVTAAPKKARESGIAENNIFPFWDWVGGRYSLWSAIGLSIAIAIGMDNFYALLHGAYTMDQHFLDAPITKNMPIILALLSIWNINFWDTRSLAIIPYDQYLEYFPAYLQQLIMESNGKRVRSDGNNVSYKTAPAIWGGVGTDGQHAFHQALLQRTQIIPVDFILPLKSHNHLDNHHLLLCANCFAQSQALMQGKTLEEVCTELQEQKLSPSEIEALAPHKVIPGNSPSNTILIDQVDPSTLGSLIALYEHKTFVEGIIWEINSFDQWGVELGKQLCHELTAKLQGKNSNLLDSSTEGLIKKYIASH